MKPSQWKPYPILSWRKTPWKTTNKDSFSQGWEHQNKITGVNTLKNMLMSCWNGMSAQNSPECVFCLFSEAKRCFLYNVSEAISGHGTAFFCFVLKADKNLMFGLFSAWNNPCSSIILSDCLTSFVGTFTVYKMIFISKSRSVNNSLDDLKAVMKTFTLRSHPPLEDSWQKDPNQPTVSVSDISFELWVWGENSGISSQGPTWAKPFTLTHHWLGQYSGQHQCPGIRWGFVHGRHGVFCMQHMLPFVWDITSIALSFPSVDHLSVGEMLLVCENTAHTVALWYSITISSKTLISTIFATNFWGNPLKCHLP